MKRPIDDGDEDGERTIGTAAYKDAIILTSTIH